MTDKNIEVLDYYHSEGHKVSVTGNNGNYSIEFENQAYPNLEWENNYKLLQESSEDIVSLIKLIELDINFLKKEGYFIDEQTKLKCYINRHPSFFHLCGYVRLPDSLKDISKSELHELDIHGGITFEPQNTCGYFNPPKDKNERWIGFDCGHNTDIVPLMGMGGKFGKWHIYESILDIVRRPTKRYRTVNFVKEECKKLAKQLMELADKNN